MCVAWLTRDGQDYICPIEQQWPALCWEHCQLPSAWMNATKANASTPREHDANATAKDSDTKH